MNTLPIPLPMNICRIFTDLDNDAHYGERFRNHSSQVPVGQPIMLMNETKGSRSGFDDETSELYEVFRILKPSQNYNQICLNQLEAISSIALELTVDMEDEYEGAIQDQKTPPSVEEQPCCKCPKSKCLKLYCTCLQKGNYCGSNCSCNDCFNDVWHEEQRQSVMKSEKFKNLFQGCKCKRSKCTQNYCECLNNNKDCTDACKCKGCKNHNKFGSKSKMFDDDEKTQVCGTNCSSTITMDPVSTSP